jgi:peptidoglycan/LPS O-acetylase OafA/YrhL
MSSGQDSHDERLAELDVLRGLAALAVMLYHYTVRFTQLYPNFPPAAAKLPCGFFGVEFFCISGFVIS